MWGSKEAFHSREMESLVGVFSRALFPAEQEFFCFPLMLD